MKHRLSILGLVLIMFSILVSGCTSDKDQLIENLEKQVADQALMLEALEEQVENKREEALVLESQLEEKEVALESALDSNNEQAEELERVKGKYREALKSLLAYENFDQEMIGFFDRYDGRIFTSDFQPIDRMASLDTERGIRVFPSEDSPVFGWDEIISGDYPVVDDQVYVYGYFNSRGYGGWAFVTSDYYSTGYVLKSELGEYEPVHTQNYDCPIGFQAFKIGMKVDDAMEIYKENTELIKDRLSFYHVFRVNRDTDNRYWDIDFWFLPDDRRVSVINTSSPKYPLDSGFKVGDAADEVFAYYDELYPLSEYFNSENFRRYDIGNGYSLDFSVGDDGKITSIMINGGGYSYA